MTYNSELAKISRRKIDLIILKMDYCAETFGVSPCTAGGPVKCYNTFPTCKDTLNYNKTEKQYKFINNQLPYSVINDYYGAKPYIKTPPVSLPTEIKEKDTLVKRLKVEFLDEIENTDVGLDPYYADRTSIQGTYWKKFIARNKNYKGRIIELYEGFEGMAEADFQLKFAGRIDNIEIKNNGVVLIEAVDLMKKLSEIKYPLNLGIETAEAVPMYFEAYGLTQMLGLNALQNDICRRKDFKTFNIQAYAGTGGSLIPGTYYYKIVAYDAYDQPYMEGSDSITLTTGETAVDISWSKPSTSISYYKVFFRTTDYDQYEQLVNSVNLWSDSGQTGTAGTKPIEAQRFYQLNGDDPTIIPDWYELHNITIALSDVSDLDEPGYIKIGDEIIYYDSISGNVLQAVKRIQFDTESERNDTGTVVYKLIYYGPGNPFTYLKELLTLGGIDADYISSKFDTYVSSWNSINFSTSVIAKKTTLAKIYFDLVNSVNCMSWVGEDGKIEILKHSEDPDEYTTITDAENIINKSASVDLNDESRRTRWVLFWNRFNLDKNIDDREAYNRVNITVDATAESADEYNDEKEDLQYTTWLNDDSNARLGDTDAYINILLALRKNRTRDAQIIFNCDVELKDNSIKTGDLIKLSTDKLQDEDGNAYSSVPFRVIRKEPKDNKINLKLKRRFH